MAETVNLDRAEFDFSSIPPEECRSCVLYEYARESAYVAWLSEQISTPSGQRKQFRRKWQPDEDGCFTFLVLWQNANWTLRLPSNYRDLPYARLREERLRNPIAEASEPESFGRLNAGPKLVVRFNFGEASHRFGIGTTFFAVAPYGRTSEVIEQFTKALQESRRKRLKDNKFSDEPGRLTDSMLKDWLVQLSAFRLERAFREANITSAVKAAIDYCETRGIEPPYNNKSQWSDATKVVRKRIGGVFPVIDVPHRPPDDDVLAWFSPHSFFVRIPRENAGP